MQLQIHPGLVSKAEDVKSLVWLIPFLRGDVLHCASLYTYTKLLCDPVHHRPSCAISTLPKSQKLLQCQHNWSPAVRRLPLPPHLFIEMPSLRFRCISFMVNPALDLSHFGTLISGLLYTALLFT